MDNKNFLMKCRMCPRNCGVNRYESVGFCGCTDKIKINSWQEHHGEEPYISGFAGSGTIFFSGCNLACVFCQNYKISQLHYGKEYAQQEVGQIMLDLQNRGVHNINLVTPSHFSLLLKEVIISAKKKGLNIPIVWNSNSWEKTSILFQLNGLVDIYLADFKYGNDDYARRFSGADNYFEIATAAISEMYSQVGNIILDDFGIAQKGLAIRILILPEDVSFTAKILRWLADNIGNEVHLSLMSQYYPAWKALENPPLNRPLDVRLYRQAVNLADSLGFQNCLTQELIPSPDWTPDFKE